MQDDQLRHSLADLFSDLPPPEPQAKPEAAPPAATAEPPREPRAEPPEPETRAEAAPPAVTAEPILPTSALPGPPTRDVTAPRFRPTGLTIRRRLTWGFVLVLLLLLVSGVANVWALTRLGQANTRLHRESERVAAALQVARASADMLTVLGYASSSQDPAYLTEELSKARAVLANARRGLSEAVADLPPNDEVRSEASRVDARVARADSLTDLIVPAAQAENWERVRFYQAEVLVDYHRIVVQSVEEIVALTEERLDAAVAEATDARRLALLIPSALAVLASAAAVGTAVATTRSIVDPVNRLMEGAMRLATGDLRERVPIERRDELGRLATAFNEMADRLQVSYAELEQQVKDRTQALQKANYALQRRAIQLEASAEIGRAITSIFDLGELLRQAVDLIRNRFGFYHAGIFLLDEAREWAVLQEATGEAGAQMKAQGHRLAVGETSMVGWTAYHRQARIALDVGKDAVRFAHPLLPHTRSEMTLPLMVGERLLGVLNVQSTEEAAFDDDDVRSLRSMADQIAVAIENTRRVSDEALLLEATSPIYRASRRLTTAMTTTEVADAIIDSVAETGADGCVVVEFEFTPDGDAEALMYLGVWRRDQEPQFQTGLRLPIAESPFPLEMVSSMWTVADVEKDKRLPRSARQVFEATGVRALANIPLRTTERVFGQIVVLHTVPGPFSDAALRLYETLSDQASVAMERVRLLEVTHWRAEEEATLRAIGDRLARAMDTGAVLRSAAEGLGQALQATGVYIELGTGLSPADLEKIRPGTGPLAPENAPPI